MNGIQEPFLTYKILGQCDNYSPATVPTYDGNLDGKPASNCGTIFKNLRVLPIPFAIAKDLIIRHHYLGSFPGGTMLTFGVFIGKKLLGAAVLGAGPYLAYGIVEGAKPDDCIVLTRFWLADQLPANSESRVIGIILRHLRKETNVKFVIAYSDPSAGHSGTIYQATNWTYVGLSSATPLCDLGDGILRHSRSVGQTCGTHSIREFAKIGIPMKQIPQMAKHRYVYFLDKNWHSRLRLLVLPYPKQEVQVADN